MNRRRFLGTLISIGGVAGASAVMASQIGASDNPSHREITVWRSHTMGADVAISIRHDQTSQLPDLDAHLKLIEKEIAELETIFDLYHPDSLLSTLNRTGHLDDPPLVMISLLHQVSVIHSLTNGYFDPTIQPLWEALAWGKDPDRARQLIGFDSVDFNSGRIAFAQPGMALSLNGIIQGFVTDIVSRRIMEFGYSQSLVNMGEFWASGGWDMAVENSDGAIIARPQLADKAIATSSPYSLSLGEVSHILPITVDTKPKWKTVSVIAENAALADGLSTGSVYLDLGSIQTIARHPAVEQVLLESMEGKRHTLGEA